MNIGMMAWMEKTFHAVVAGKSDIKFSSTTEAVIQLMIPLREDTVIRDPDSQSGISEQPSSDIEAVHGALNRARGLHVKYPGKFIAAHENTVAERGHERWVDLAYVVVVSPSGILTIRHTEEVPVPYELIVASRVTGWAKTCGKLEADRDPLVVHDDPHCKWSGGKRSRLSLLADATYDALSAAIVCERGAR